MAELNRQAGYATATGCIKKCPKYKIASKLDICKITDNQQQPTANIEQ